ncbi:hypothetical protein DICPUDRAFT_48369 [Dictyostelium purpureum]|uniref:Cyclopropane-fatty-acyl-phospholipid synthase n=1 Tax=Dictyostelium purpureum TaxID=5786 RepID=F0ZNX0_DICPU|nr:uncharacterized protein DICPUDRAFT_48369 [Dictyostelium purpureum]EGC34382.1 hypothetical protein DICPUDRAFT_48369 [Dictyostelium purpureum]|eukprot:XP_003289116.1 hypothetical protein DICPUDRAFT_48369 [Dictyostelium purpureum]
MNLLVPSPARNYFYQSFVSYAHSFLFKNFLTKIKYGHLIVDIKDTNFPQYIGTPSFKYGDDKGEVKARIQIINLYRFFFKVLFGGDVGFSESFILGDFVCDDLKNLITIFILNRNELDNFNTKWSFVMDGVNRLAHYLHRNTIEGSKENIKAHYDLSNEMFSLFLDKTMSYSCAYFDHREQDLESAQMNKIRKLIDKANLTPDCELLEIGSGWLELAIEAVRRTGCRVTTVSLSQQQISYGLKKVEEAGLSDRITILYKDYRHIEGKFDRIISCEMLEAVGYENYPSYFQALERLLKPNGIFVVQFITFKDQDFHGLIKRCDFIQKYIFPGGLLPSITSIMEAATNHSNLVLQHAETFGTHYAITLDIWKKNFFENKDKILALGFDQQFINMFDYYFCYCSAAFETRTINLIQMQFSRPCNVNLNDFKK